MPADAHVGDAFAQEHFAGHAEDHFEITNLDARVEVPYARFDHAMRTKEWTPLEPGVPRRQVLRPRHRRGRRKDGHWADRDAEAGSDRHQLGTDGLFRIPPGGMQSCYD